MSELAVGGQAIIEGVMYRKGRRLSLAVQHPKKGVLVKKKRIRSLFYTHKRLDIPFVRGIIMLFETLFVGVQALHTSANMVASKADERLSTKELIFTLVISLGFALLIFKVLPLVLTSVLGNTVALGAAGFNAIEGGLKFLFLILYLILIARMADVRRLFQYHGAEHKVINCHEAGKKLTLRNVQRFTTYHPRCGTSFIVFVVLLSIVFYFFIPLSLPFGLKLLVRLILLPIIAGVGYELIRLSGKHAEKTWLQWLLLPGKAVQKLTTREPTPKQVKVALASLQAVLG